MLFMAVFAKFEQTTRAVDILREKNQKKDAYLKNRSISYAK